MNTFISCAEFENVTRVGPSFLVSRLNDHFILGGGGEAVKDEAGRVGERVPEVGARPQVVNGWDDVGPLHRLLHVTLRLAKTVG